MTIHPPRTVAVSLKVEDLLDKALRGEVRVPPFQRPLRWGHEENRLLLESIFLGYPVGALLFWERRGEAQRLQIGPITVDAPVNDRTWWIVDGQQRITALVGSLGPQSSDVVDRNFRFFLNLESEKIESNDSSKSIPLQMLGDSERILHWLDRWELKADNSELVRRAVSASKRFREYQLPAYVVSSVVQEDVVDIFQRLNASGKRLKKADVVGALDRTDNQPGHLDQLQSTISKLEFGKLNEDTLVSALLAVAGKEPTKRPSTNWRASPSDYAKTAYGLTSTIVFLRNQVGIPHAELLPYSLPLVVFAKFFSTFPTPTHRSRVLLSRWFWRATQLGALRGDNIPLVRRFFAVIDSEDEELSVRRLVSTLSTERPTINLQRTFSLRTALSKVEILTLLKFSPQTQDGDPVDVGRLANGSLTAVLGRFVKRGTSDLGESVAGRILHPSPRPTWATRARVIPAEFWNLAESRDSFWSSHAIDPDWFGLPVSEFLTRRSERILQKQREWLRAASGEGESDRPSLQRLFVEEEAS